MADHLGRLILHLPDVTVPFQALLQKISASVWGLAQQGAFYKLKDVLCSNSCNGCYGLVYTTTVTTDSGS